MLNAGAVKAPGIAWLGQFFVPAGRLFGSLETGLLFSVLLTQAATLFLMFAILRRLFPSRPSLAVLGMLICGASPLFIGLTHQYFVEPLQMFAVIYVYWLAIASFDFNRFSIASHIIMATAVAMLAKITTPGYCLFPALIVFWNALCTDQSQATKSSGATFRRWMFFGFSLAVLLSACVWYKRHFVAILQFARESAVGEVGLLYGARESFLKTVTYWLQASQKAFVLPPVLLLLTAIACLGFVCEFWLRYRRGESPFSALSRRQNAFVLAAAANTVVVFLLLGFSTNRETRFLLPLLPALVIIVVWVFSISNWRAPTIAGCAALVFQWGVIHVNTLALYGPSSDRSTTENEALDYCAAYEMRMSPYVKRVTRDGTRKAELQRLIDLTCSSDEPIALNICGVDAPWFNADTLSFYAAQRRASIKARTLFASLGFAASDPDASLQIVHASNCRFFVSLVEDDLKEQPAFLNKVSLPVLARIRANSAFNMERFDSGYGVVVFRNTGRTEALR